MTSFFGIGHATAERLCARVLIHDRCRIRDLTPLQITSLTAYFSSPTSAAPGAVYPLAGPKYEAPPFGVTLPAAPRKAPVVKGTSKDPLLKVKLEIDLKREVWNNIAHQRMIGSYVGRRHAMGMPVRGQNTRTNARTARRLNRIDRKI